MIKSMMQIYNLAIENKELEITLPSWLKNSIKNWCNANDKYNNGEIDKIDLLEPMDDLYGDINCAQADKDITIEEANLLRYKYLEKGCLK